MLIFLCCFCFVFHQVYFLPASHLPWSHSFTPPLPLLIPLFSPPLLPCVKDVMIVLPRLTIILQCGVIVVIGDVLMADVSLVSVNWMILVLLFLLCKEDYGHRLLDVGSPMQSLKSNLFFVFYTLIIYLYRTINLAVFLSLFPAV